MYEWTYRILQCLQSLIHECIHKERVYFKNSIVSKYKQKYCVQCVYENIEGDIIICNLFCDWWLESLMDTDIKYSVCCKFDQSAYELSGCGK